MRVTEKEKDWYIFVANYNRANDIHQYETWVKDYSEKIILIYTGETRHLSLLALVNSWFAYQ